MLRTLKCHTACGPASKSSLISIKLSCFSPSLTHSQCAMSTCPARKIIPMAKLVADNAGELELTTHRRAVASAAAAASTAPPPNFSSPLPASSPPLLTDTEDTADQLQVRGSLKQTSHTLSSTLSLDSVIILSPTTSDNTPDAAPSSKKPKTLPASEHISKMWRKLRRLPIRQLIA